MDRNALLAAGRPKPHRVETAEMGPVLLRPLTLPELLAAEAGQAAAGDDPLARARWMAAVVTRCVCDERGNRVLEDADADAVLAWPAAALGRLFRAASQLSAVTPERVEEQAGN
jgi:hypothetical protein